MKKLVSILTFLFSGFAAFGQATVMADPNTAILKAPGGFFQVNGIPVINVMAYGAVGDGVTDDTTAWRLAFAAQQTAGTNAVMTAPPRIFAISGGIGTNGANTPFLFWSPSSVNYTGSSKSNSWYGPILSCGGNAISPFTVTGGRNMIQGLGVVYNNANISTNTAAAALTLNNAYESLIANNYFSSGYYGILGTGINYNNRFENNWITAASGSQVDYSGGTTSTWIHNYFQNVFLFGTTNAALGAGLSISGYSIDGTGTNVTYTFSGSFPNYFNTNSALSFSGVSYTPSIATANQPFFVNKIPAANQLTVSTPIVVTSVTLSSATVALNNCLQYAPMIVLRNGGNNSFVGCDFEQTTLATTNLIQVTSASGGYNIFLDCHFEGISFTNITAVNSLIFNSSKFVTFNTAELINSSIFPGQTLNIAYNAGTASFFVNTWGERDVAMAGATQNLGGYQAGADKPIFGRINLNGTLRVNGVPSISSFANTLHPAWYWYQDNTADIVAMTPGEPTTLNTSFGVGTPYGQSGSYNANFGYNAGNALTTGNQNAFFGVNAGQYGQAAGTVGIGYAAANSGAQNAVLIGRTAGNNDIATGNVGIGYRALQNANVSGASGNVVLGYQAAVNATSPTNNIALGNSVAPTLATGYGNILIGSGADVDVSGRNNAIVLGVNAKPGADNQFTLGSSGTKILTTTNGATTGSGTLSLPSLPQGYLKIRLNGVDQYFPYY